MINYLKTSADCFVIKAELKRQLSINKKYVVIPNKLSLYLKEKYNLTIYNIIDKIIMNVNVTRIKNNLVQIFITDINIKDTTLTTIINLIEYGTLDIPASKAISSLFNKCILKVKDYLGGI